MMLLTVAWIPVFSLTPTPRVHDKEKIPHTGFSNEMSSLVTE